MALTLTVTAKMDCDKDQLKMIIITDSKWVANNLGSMSAFFRHHVSYILFVFCFFLHKNMVFLWQYELNIERCNVSYIDVIGGGPKNANA